MSEQPAGVVAPSGGLLRSGGDASSSVRRRRVDLERRAELLGALEELLLSEGFTALTVDDMARRLHCSKATLYSVATSKEQLVIALTKHFFRQATEAVEAETAGETDPALRVTAYLTAVARALVPATPAFHRDLDSFPPGRAVYEQNTAAAAERVRQLIDEGVSAGHFRAVHPALIADTVTTLMFRIGRGETARATGLDDAAAYRELAALLLHGISL